MPRTLARLFRCSLLVAAVIVSARAASARGIYCSSFEWVTPSRGMICLRTCVYCEDQDNGNVIVGIDCYDGSCWFGRPVE